MQVGSIVRKQMTTFNPKNLMADMIGVVTEGPFIEQDKGGGKRPHVMVRWGKSSRSDKVMVARIQEIESRKA